MQHKAAELPLRAKIDRQPLGFALTVLAYPCRTGIAIDRQRGCSARQLGRRLRDRLRPGVRYRRQRTNRQLLKVDGTFATAAAGADDKLDAVRMFQHAVFGRSPREQHLALLDAHQLPLLREVVVLLRVPPDVIAAGIGHLELEMVHRRFGAYVEPVSYTHLTLPTNREV